MISRRTLLIHGGNMAVSAAMGANTWPLAVANASEKNLEEVPAWDVHVHLVNLRGSVPERVSVLLKHADRVGVEKIVVHMGTTLVSHPTPDEFRRQNDEVLQAVSASPSRVMGFAYLNPHYERESLRELDRCVRDGPMVGVKLWIALACSRPELNSIAQRCGELRVPIIQMDYFIATWAGPMPDW